MASQAVTRNWIQADKKRGPVGPRLSCILSLVLLLFEEALVVVHLELRLKRRNGVHGHAYHNED